MEKMGKHTPLTHHWRTDFSRKEQVISKKSEATAPAAALLAAILLRYMQRERSWSQLGCIQQSCGVSGCQHVREYLGI